MSTLAPEAGISGRDKLLHPTEYCGMQLPIPAWDTSIWHQSPHMSYHGSSTGTVTRFVTNNLDLMNCFQSGEVDWCFWICFWMMCFDADIVFTIMDSITYLQLFRISHEVISIQVIYLKLVLNSDLMKSHSSINWVRCNCCDILYKTWHSGWISFCTLLSMWLLFHAGKLIHISKRYPWYSGHCKRCWLWPEFVEPCAQHHVLFAEMTSDIILHDTMFWMRSSFIVLFHSILTFCFQVYWRIRFEVEQQRLQL